MTKKNILVFNPGSLFPMNMASQDRVFKMVTRLAKDHSVDLATIAANANEVRLSHQEIGKNVHRFFPIYSLNYNKTRIARKLVGLKWYANYLVSGSSKRSYYWGADKILKQLIDIINQKNYDVVQMEYWYSGGILSRLPESIYKVIDTHDVTYEKKEREYLSQHGDKLPFFKRREYETDKAKEIAVIKSANAVISISEYDLSVFQAAAPQAKHILIPTGQDLSEYLNFPHESIEKVPTVLFYGSLGGVPNVAAFFRLYKHIFPKIRQQVPEVKLLILGANPSKEMKRLASQPHIEVTGYVKDVRSYLACASVMILPLSLGGGFRSRVIEVMAMGVPVLGTHNALDSVGLRHEVEGFIDDNDDILADKAVDILKNNRIRKAIAEAALNFVKKNYSVEVTYGKLSKFYAHLP